MPVINFSNPFSIFVGVVLFVLVLYLAKENKKAWITGTMLFTFIGLLVCHTIEFALLGSQSQEAYKDMIVNCIALDFIMIFISFFSYLWVDDISCRFYKKKSIDNSLDWFWNKV